VEWFVIMQLLFQVVVPKTYQKYTSRKVLTTSWIDGEKLSQSIESDVGELVNVGVICYLKQVTLPTCLLRSIINVVLAYLRSLNRPLCSAFSAIMLNDIDLGMLC